MSMHVCLLRLNSWFQTFEKLLAKLFAILFLSFSLCMLLVDSVLFSVLNSSKLSQFELLVDAFPVVAVSSGSVEACFSQTFLLVAL